MRRVKYPDAEGYWWLIDKGTVRGPIRFYYYGSKLTYEDASWASYHNPDYEFEGPVPEPRVPLKFSGVGIMDIQSKYKHIAIGYIDTPIPDRQNIRVKFTIEEILCEE